MSDLNQKLDAVLQRLNDLEKMIVAAIPRSRRTRKAQAITATPQELLDERVDAVVILFEDFVDKPLFKRKGARVPNYLLENMNEPPFGAVTEAILANRASMLKLFQPVFIYNEKSSNEVARTAIREAAKRGSFVLVQLCDSGIDVGPEYQDNKTLIVMSHTCANRLNGMEPKKKVEIKKLWTPPVKEPEPETNTDCPDCGGHVEDGYCFDCEWNNHGDKCAKHGTALKDGDCPECEREEDEAREGGLL